MLGQTLQRQTDQENAQQGTDDDLDVCAVGKNLFYILAGDSLPQAPPQKRRDFSQNGNILQSTHDCITDLVENQLFSCGRLDRRLASYWLQELNLSFTDYPVISSKFFLHGTKFRGLRLFLEIEAGYVCFV